MAKLIALLSSGKGSWAQVNSLLKVSSWDHVYLLCNDYSYENFEVKDPQKITKIKFNEHKPANEVDKLAQFFKKNIKDFNVGLNLSSGTGMEHMAVVSAVLKSGLGLRFVYADFNELKEFEIMETWEVEENEH